MTFSFNDAYRLIHNVVQEKVSQMIKSGAGVDIAWGSVASLDGGGLCSVYLYGDTVASTGFRLENGIVPVVGNPVRVSIDRRGNRWVDAIINQSAGTPPMEINPRGASIKLLGATLRATSPNILELVSGDRLDGFLRFVPVANTLILNATWTSATGMTTLSAGVPADAKLVQVQSLVQMQSGTATAVCGLDVGHGTLSDASPAALRVVVPPSGTGFWSSASIDLVLSSGNIRYERTYSGTGTVLGRIYVTGYWTDKV